MMDEGTFSLIILHENQHSLREKEVFIKFNMIKVRGDNCADPKAFRCPQNIEVCATNFIECQMIDDACMGLNPSAPYKCRDGNKNDICVSSVGECC
jgi:hypothetical protein